MAKDSGNLYIFKQNALLEARIEKLEKHVVDLYKLINALVEQDEYIPPNEERESPTQIDDLCKTLVTRAVLAERMGVSERTIARYSEIGLPCVRIGLRVMYDIPTVHKWIMDRNR